MGKIDFVIPWVDGADEKWLKKKKRYDANGEESVDVSAERYRDWGTLKYVFRGIEKYAPWVNKVFFVTDNQVPEWLDTSHKKLVCVDHSDYIPEKYLPVFSSHPIELNFHRISGLSEQFVYLNDDIFLTGDVQPEDFFYKGLPCDSAVESPITPNRKDVFNDILMNNMILINELFDRTEVIKKNRKLFYSLKDKEGLIRNLCFAPLRRKDFFGFEYSHLASPLLKSTLENVWEKSYQWLDETCTHRFRSRDDVNQYIFRYYQYAVGKFYPYNWRKTGKVFQLNDSKERGNVEETCAEIVQGKLREICVNEADVLSFSETKEKICGAFETKFPDKSKFER